MKSTLERVFLTPKFNTDEEFLFVDTGADSLAKYARYNKLSSDMLNNYTTELIKGRLDLLQGSTHEYKSYHSNDIKAIMDSGLKVAEEVYDFIFIDVSSGIKDMSIEVIDQCDLIVMNVNQNMFVWDDLIQNYEKYLDKMVFVFGKYDENSRFSYKNIQRKYKFKNRTGIIPYDIEFADACSQSTVIEFLKRNRAVEKDDTHYYLMDEARKSMAMILSSVGIDHKLKKVE